MRTLLAYLLLLIAFDVHADALVVRVLSATVSDTKADGKAWDANGGAPDLKLTLKVDGREVASCAAKNSTFATCRPDARVETAVDATLELVVVDVDLGRDDPAGVATARRPVQVGIHELTPTGTLTKASVEFAVRAVPTAKASANKALTKVPTTRAATESSTPSSQWPDWVAWLIGLGIGGLLGGLLLRLLSTTAVRLAIGGVCAVGGFGVAVGLVFEQLSASTMALAVQWTLGAVAAVLGGAELVGDRRRPAICVLAAGLAVFLGPLVVYGVIGITILAVALLVIQGS